MTHTTQTYVTWLIHTWRDWFICDMTPIFICDMTPNCMAGVMSHMNQSRHAYEVMSHMNVGVMSHMNQSRHVTVWRDLSMSDRTHSYVKWLMDLRSDSSTCDVTISYVTCLIRLMWQVVRICVCVCVCVWMCMCVCVNMHVCVRVCLRARVHVWVRGRVYCAPAYAR